MDVAFGILAFGLIIVGLVGILLPVLPGTGFVYAGILIYAFTFGIDTIGKGTLVILGLLMVFSMAIDYLASAYGATRFGASSWGSTGAVIGGLIGFFVFNFPGLIAGIFLGAVLGEVWGAKQDWSRSLRIGLGSLIGFLGGTFMKLLIGLVMVGVFLYRIWGSW